MGSNRGFFQHQVLHRQLGHQFLQPFILPLQGLDLSSAGLSLSVPLEAAFPGLHEILQPFVVDVGGDAFPPAERGDGNLSSDPFNDDPHLLFGTELSSGDPFGAAYDLPGVFIGLVVVGVCVDHLGSFSIEIYIDPEARTTSSNH